MERLLCIWMLGVGLVSLKGTESVVADAEMALARLKADQVSMVTGDDPAARARAIKREETAHTQHPIAVVVACSDSRSAPELVFQAEMGDLFVVRTAGNLADDHALGSIEYAVHHLGVRLIVVMGHERCGAVTAAVNAHSAPGHVHSLVRDIQPAVEAVRERKAEGDIVDLAIAENARQVAQRIRESSEWGEALHEVQVVAAVYDLDSGLIEWLDESVEHE